MLPVVIGGDNNDRNLIMLCHNCHRQTVNYFKTKLKNIKKVKLNCQNNKKKTPYIVSPILNLAKHLVQLHKQIYGVIYLQIIQTLFIIALQFVTIILFM